MMRFQRTLVTVACAAVAASLAGCGGSDHAAHVAQAPDTAVATPSPSAPVEDAGQFGPACAQVPTSGPGSFQGMALAPVATAASNNPVLSTLVTAVKKANLVDTLNSAKGITVFAPDNAAFAKIPAATLSKVLADNATLTKILEFHVVPRTITPAELASGSFGTLEGATIRTSGSGQDFTIGDSAHVVCGGVRTANATVYIIDGVLMPPKS